MKLSVTDPANETEMDLIRFLKSVENDPQSGILALRTDAPGLCIEVALDSRHDWLADSGLFDRCNDDLATRFLEAFVAGKLSVNFPIAMQLSKLLAKRGGLIRETIEPLLATPDWRSLSAPSLLLSYLALHGEGERIAMQLLDTVPEDCRDGLFLACYRRESEVLDRKLMQKFAAWDLEDWHPTATGEIVFLGGFIAKWLARYPFADLENVIRIYFRRRCVAG